MTPPGDAWSIDSANPLPARQHPATTQWIRHSDRIAAINLTASMVSAPWAANTSTSPGSSPAAAACATMRGPTHVSPTRRHRPHAASSTNGDRSETTPAWNHHRTSPATIPLARALCSIRPNAAKNPAVGPLAGKKTAASAAVSPCPLSR